MSHHPHTHKHSAHSHPNPHSQHSQVDRAHEHRQSAQHHAQSGHGGHIGHAGHDPDIFKHRFWICLVLTLPSLYFSPQIQEWLGYQAIAFPGSNWVTPLLAIAIYFYGGWVFLKGHRCKPQVALWKR